MRSLKQNKFYFNMVEIILAIGILAIGFSSILGIFPVAVKIVRNSQTEGIVSDMIGDISAHYTSWANTPLISTSTPRTQLDGEYWYTILFADSIPSSSTDAIAQYGTYFSNTRDLFFEENDLESGRKLREEVIKAIDNKDNNYLNGNFFLNKLREKVKAILDNDIDNDVRYDLSQDLTTSSPYSSSSSPPIRMKPQLNLFQPELPSAIGSNPTRYVMFYLVKGDSNFNRIDLTAQVLVWKTQMRPTYQSGDTSLGTLVSYDKAVILNFEVSWPINVPYHEREVRYYQFTITNPKKM